MGEKGRAGEFISWGKRLMGARQERENTSEETNKETTI